MRSEINLTDEQIEAAFGKLGLGLSLSMGDDENIVYTRETLEDFKSARENYAERGRINETLKTDYPSLVIDKMQLKKGEPRQTLHVIDFGAVRACYVF